MAEHGDNSIQRDLCLVQVGGCALNEHIPCIQSYLTVFPLNQEIKIDTVTVYLVNNRGGKKPMLINRCKTPCTKKSLKYEINTQLKLPNQTI